MSKLGKVSRSSIATDDLRVQSTCLLAVDADEQSPSSALALESIIELSHTRLPCLFQFRDEAWRDQSTDVIKNVLRLGIMAVQDLLAH